MAALTSSAGVALPAPTHSGSWPRSWGPDKTGSSWNGSRYMIDESSYTDCSKAQLRVVAAAGGTAGKDARRSEEGADEVWWHYGAVEALQLAVTRARAAAGFRPSALLRDLALFCRRPTPEAVPAVEACLRCCLAAVTHTTIPEEFGSRMVLSLEAESSNSTQKYLMAKAFAGIAAKEALRVGLSDPVSDAMDAASACGALAMAETDRDNAIIERLRAKVAEQAAEAARKQSSAAPAQSSWLGQQEPSGLGNAFPPLDECGSLFGELTREQS